MTQSWHSGGVPVGDDCIAGDLGWRVSDILNRARFARENNMCTVVDHGPAHCAVQDGYPAPLDDQVASNLPVKLQAYICFHRDIARYDAPQCCVASGGNRSFDMSVRSRSSWLNSASPLGDAPLEGAEPPRSGGHVADAQRATAPSRSGYATSRSWNQAQLPRLRPSERRTLEYIGDGEFRATELDWVAPQRLKRMAASRA